MAESTFVRLYGLQSTQHSVSTLVCTTQKGPGISQGSPGGALLTEKYILQRGLIRLGYTLCVR